MRISDWSSDVCSSDLRRLEVAALVTRRGAEPGPVGRHLAARFETAAEQHRGRRGAMIGAAGAVDLDRPPEFGRDDDERVVPRRTEPRLQRADQLVEPAELRRQPVSLAAVGVRSEEHTSELPSLMRNSYAVFFL